MNILHSSRSNEWYTPEWIIQKARLIMGGIDLDPASCPRANEVVKASTYFSEGGLDRKWWGRVWLNPPYGRQAGFWVSGAVEKMEAGEIEQAVLLVNATTDRTWFHRLWGLPLVFLYKRVRFWRDGEPASSPTHGSVLVGLGVDEEKFARVFKAEGRFVK